MPAVAEQTTIKLSVTRTERQRQAWEALDDPGVRRVLYGGAKGGGKSFLACVWAFTYAWQVMSEFGLKPSKNPPHIGWMGRKQAVDFTSTTLQTWRQTIPEEYYELRGGTEKDSKHILIMDRVAIDYGGLDRQENVNKFNSAEYAFVIVDQAEEVDRDDISVLRGSLRLTINGKALPYKELYTANPRNCWLRDDFITDSLPGGVFVPALPSDNPHLPDNYEQTLIDAFGYRPELLAAYLKGDWSVLEGESQVILDRWLVRAMASTGVYEGKVIACDVARFGDDKTVIMVMEGSEVIHEEAMAQSRTTQVSNRLHELSRQHGNCQIVVDVIGVGAGVVDELHELGRYVIPFNASEKSEHEKYYNRRAQAWWEVAEGLSKADIGCHNMSKELRRDLTTPTYDFRNGKILIESKADIKERTGRSPDYGDCYVMGMWAIIHDKPQPTYVGIGRPIVGNADPYRNWGKRSVRFSQRRA